MGKHAAPKKSVRSKAGMVAGTVGASLGLTLLVPTSAEAATYKGAQALNVVAAQKGDWYQWGATGPSRFDCSGLMMYSFKRVGKSIPRTTNDQYARATKINAANRKPGDLVFLYSGTNEYHVMMYAGNGYVWHAPGRGKQVRKEKLWTSKVRYGRL